MNFGSSKSYSDVSDPSGSGSGIPSGSGSGSGTASGSGDPSNSGGSGSGSGLDPDIYYCVSFFNATCSYGAWSITGSGTDCLLGGDVPVLNVWHINTCGATYYKSLGPAADNNCASCNGLMAATPADPATIPPCCGTGSGDPSGSGGLKLCYERWTIQFSCATGEFVNKQMTGLYCFSTPPNTNWVKTITGDLLCTYVLFRPTGGSCTDAEDCQPLPDGSGSGSGSGTNEPADPESSADCCQGCYGCGPCCFSTKSKIRVSYSFEPCANCNYSEATCLPSFSATDVILDYCCPTAPTPGSSGCFYASWDNSRSLETVSCEIFEGFSIDVTVGTLISVSYRCCGGYVNSAWSMGASYSDCDCFWGGGYSPVGGSFYEHIEGVTDCYSLCPGAQAELAGDCCGVSGTFPTGGCYCYQPVDGYVQGYPVTEGDADNTSWLTVSIEVLDNHCCNNGAIGAGHGQCNKSEGNCGGTGGDDANTCP